MQSLAPRNKVISRFLKLAADEGWSEATLSKALKAENVGNPFAKGIYSLTEAAVLERVDKTPPRRRRVRDKIAAAVIAHLLALNRDKKAFARMGGWLLLPQNAATAGKLFYRVADALWRGCGLHSTNFSFYTQRLSLGAVYALTFYVWLGSEDMMETKAFLARRIDGLLKLFAKGS